ncbi:MAG: prenyl protease-related protein [Pseudomonas sp.]|nr:prenyl protease-related protein [Pseudomonas sp.]
MTAQHNNAPMVEPVSPQREPETNFFRRPSTSRILPFAAYMAFVAIADGLGRLGWTAEELRWLYPVKIGVVLVLLLACWRTYVELARPALGWRAACEAIVVGVVVLVLWVNLDAGWMQVGSSAGFDPTSGGEIDWWLVAVRIAGAALVVPVMEELFWRSFLMRWIESRNFLALRPALVGLQAFLITAVLFGIEHNLWFAGVVAGVAYGYLYMRSENLWSPILAHAVTNALLGIWVVSTAEWTYW